MRAPWLSPALMLTALLPALALAATVPPKSKAAVEPDIATVFAAGRAAKHTELMPGLSYNMIEAPQYGLTIHAWRFEQDKFRLRVALQKKATGSPVSELLDGAPNVFAINGGFFERDKQRVLTASGLVIMHGDEISPEQDRAGSGIIYSGAGGVGIGYRKELRGHGFMAEAIQVGPILVDPGGKISVRDTQHDRQNRTAVCLKPGVFLAVVVDGGLSLYQFAEMLSEPEANGGFGCDVAINLDGGPSTQASYRISGKQTDILPGRPVQNALIISTK